MQPNSVYSRTWGETVFDVRSKFDENKYKVEYKLNNFGHRCDNFSKQDKDNHVLFAGCSFAFGEGVPYMQNWSGKLYKKIESKYDIGGYYCLGFQNGVTSVIINNILKYFNSFGHPKILVCFFPDSIRKISYQNGSLDIDYRHDDEHKIIGRLSMYQSISLLENYCKQADIKFFWSTWDQSDLSFFSKLNFSNFVKIEEVDIIMNATNVEEKDNIFYNVARDGAHPGLKYSDGLANIFYNILVRENYEKV